MHRPLSERRFDKCPRAHGFAGKKYLSPAASAANRSGFFLFGIPTIGRKARKIRNAPPPKKYAEPMVF
jgi:hypothetical protein